MTIKIKVVKDIIIIYVNKYKKKVTYKKNNIIIQNIKTIKLVNKV